MVYHFQRKGTFFLLGTFISYEMKIVKKIYTKQNLDNSTKLTDVFGIKIKQGTLQSMDVYFSQRKRLF